MCQSRVTSLCAVCVCLLAVFLSLMEAPFGLPHDAADKVSDDAILLYCIAEQEDRGIGTA